MTSAPLATASAATTDESTPPDMATTIRLAFAARVRSNSAAAASGASRGDKAAVRVISVAAHTRAGRRWPVSADRRTGNLLMRGELRLYRFLTDTRVSPRNVRSSHQA